MLLRLVHRTTFVYAGHARDSFNEVRLHPVNDPLQTCRKYELHLDPAVPARAYTDFYGNQVEYFDITTSHSKLVVEAESEVETVPNALRPPVPNVPFEALAASADRDLLAEFTASSHYVPLDVEVLGGGAQVSLALHGVAIPGRHATHLGTVLYAIPGALAGMALIYAIGAARERSSERLAGGPFGG